MSTECPRCDQPWDGSRCDRCDPLIAADFLLDCRKHKPMELRLGQHMMNQLFKEDPVLYAQVVDAKVDPFYNDDNVRAFEELVIKNWKRTRYE